jgi:fimbrial isopeptide formation D2 family protein/uncharacterized repeat protein (TIGR01451 family)
MNMTPFRQGVTRLRLFLLAAIVGVLFAAPTVVPTQAQAGYNPNGNVQPRVVLDNLGPVFLGDDFTFTARFDNAGTEPGYGPFIDLLIPAGITINNADIQYLGESLESLGGRISRHTFSASDTPHPTNAGSYCIDHPEVRYHDPVSPYRVCGAVGETAFTLILPFGSFVSGQYVELDITATLADDVPLDLPLEVFANAGFQFGDDPADNPCCDHVIFESAPTGIDVNLNVPKGEVEPRLVRVTKEVNADEAEIASGPNNPASYTINVEVARNQTISNMVIKELLPTNIVVTGITSVSGPSITLDPATMPFIPTTADNEIDIEFNSTITGAGEGNVVASFEVSFYVPFADEDGEILPASGAAWDEIENNLEVHGDWDQATDPNFPTLLYQSGVCPVNCDPANISTAKPIAIQKGSSVVGGGHIQVGSYVDYTLNFQVSDYFAFNNIVISDYLGDGLEYIGVQSYTIETHGAVYSGASFAGANTTVTDDTPNAGETTIIYRVSDQLASAHGVTGGQMLGGCIAPAGGLTTDLDTCGNGGATGQIVFRAQVREEYADNYAGQNTNIDQGDYVDNDVEIDATVLNRDTLTPTGPVITDASGTSDAIPYGVLNKIISRVTRNGTVIPAPLPAGFELLPGDQVTYRLTYTLPTDSFENLVLIDYLPLPAFDVDGFPPNIPAFHLTNDWDFGPSHSATNVVTKADVAVSRLSAANAIRFDFGSKPNPNNTPTMIDIELTATVQYRATADGLFLTNQATISEGSTRGQGSNVASSIRQVTLRNTALVIKKEIIDNTPDRATVEVTETDSEGSIKEITGPHAGDVIDFQIQIQNNGGQAAYNIIVNDEFDPSLYEYVPGSLSIVLNRGMGAPHEATIDIESWNGGGIGSATELDFFTANGVRLVDPSHGDGLCQPYDDTDGSGVITITYQLRISNDVAPGTEIPNTATIIQYNNTEEGGEEFVDPNDPPTDSTTVITDYPTVVAKGIVGTSEGHTEDGPATVAAPSEVTVANQGVITELFSTADVVIGEVVTYRIVTTVPSATYGTFRIDDDLPADVSYIPNTASYRWISTAGQVTGGLIGTNNTATLQPATPDIVGSDIAFNIASSGSPLTVLNGDEVLLIIEFDAVIRNTTGNNSGVTRTNSSSAHSVNDADETNESPAQTVPVTILEPQLQIEKTFSAPAPADDTLDAGDTFSYTLVISHRTTSPISNTTAFDVQIRDLIPDYLTLNMGSVAINLAGGASGSADLTTAGEVIVNITQMPLGSSATVTFNVTVDDDVPAGRVIDNEASVVWTSVPGERGTGNETPGDSGDPTGERNGDGGVNDYSDSDEISVTLKDLVPDKTIVTTSEAHTSDTQTGVNSANARPVTIGEIIRYQLVVTVPEGVSYDLLIQDILPTGFAPILDETAVISFSPTLTSSNGALNTAIGTAAGASFPLYDPGGSPLYGVAGYTGNTIALELGHITNSNDTNSGDDVITIQFNARVSNVSGNQHGNTRENVMVVSASEPDESRTERGRSRRWARVVEPVLVVTKTASPDTDLEAGDLVTYTIDVTNTGTVDAFDLVLSDVLPPNTVYVDTPTATLAHTAGVAPDAGTLQIVSHELGAEWARLNVGQSATIEYTVRILLSVAPNAELRNEVDLSWTSLPNDGTPGNPTGSESGTPGESDGERTGEENGAPNDYDDEAVVPIFVRNIAPTKRIITTSADHTDGYDTPDTLGYLEADATIGEVVTYELRTVIPRSTTNEFSITDQLPDDLVYISGSTTVQFLTTAPSANITSVIVNPPPATPTNGDTFAGFINVTGQTITFNFGDVTNFETGDGSETIVIRFQAYVANTTDNTATAPNNTKVNSFIVEWDGSDPDDPLTSNETVVTIVEPVITIEKVASPTSGFDAGDTITYNITVANPGAVDAFDIRVTDTFDNVLLQDHTLVSTLPAGVTGGLTGNVFDVMIDELEAADPLTGPTTITFTFTAVVTSDIQHNQIIDNMADVEWTSLPGNDPNERDGSGDPDDPTDPNVYREEDEAPVRSTLEFEVEKQIFATSNPDTLDTVSPRPLTVGEIVTFRLYTTVPYGTTNNVRIVDQLVAGIQFVDGSGRIGLFNNGNGTLTFTPTQTLGSIATVNDALPTSLPNTIYNSATRDVIVDLGDIVNTSTTGSQIIVVEFDVEVVVTANAISVNTIWDNDYVVLDDHPDGPNTGTEEDRPTPSDPVELVVVEPELTVVKTLTSSPTVDAGDTVTYNVVVTNTGNGPAYNVSIDDTFPAWLDYVSISGTNWADTGVAPANTTPFVFTGTILPSGTTNFTITFRVNSTAEIGNTFENFVTTSYTSDPDPDDGKTYDDEPSDPADEIEVVGELELVKVVYATSDTNTTDPAAPTFNDDANAGNSTGNARPVTYGETVTFRLVTTVPRATLPNVRMNDQLIEQIQYVPGSTRIGYYGDLEFPDLATAGVGAVPEIGAGGLEDIPFLTIPDGTMIDGQSWVTLDAVTGEIEIKVGDVVWNGDDTSPATSYVVVEFDAVVVREGTIIPSIFRNRYTVTYEDVNDDDETPDPSNWVYLAPFEPALTVTKAITTIDGTTVTVAPYEVQAGSVLIYTISVTNTGNAPAYDILITEDVAGLPTWLEYDGIQTANGWTETPANSGNFSYDMLSHETGSNTVTFTIGFIVNETAELSQTFTNEVVLEEFSTGEEDNPDRHTYEPDEPAESEEIEVVGELELVKVVYATDDTRTDDPTAPTFSDDANAGNSTGNARPVTFGETVTFRLVTTVPRATLPNVRMNDQLIEEIQYVPGSTRIGYYGDLEFPDLVAAGVGAVPEIGAGGLEDISFLTIPDGTMIDGQSWVTLDAVTGEIEIKVGDVAWVGNSTSPATSYVVIEFDAIIVHEGTTIPAIFTNQYTVTYEDVNDDDETPDPSNVVYLEPVVPALTVTKSITTIDGTPATAPYEVQAGSVVIYTISVTNTGNAPAYDILITEDVAGLPTWLDYDGIQTANGWTETPANSGNFSYDMLSHETGSNTVTFTIGLTVNGTAQLHDAFTNEVVLEEFSTDEDDNPERHTYEPEDPAESEEIEVVGDIVLEKIIFNTSNTYTATETNRAEADLAIGETVTFRLVTRIPAATITDVSFEDVLVDGLRYEGNARMAVFDATDPSKVDFADARFSGVSQLTNVDGVIGFAYPVDQADLFLTQSIGGATRVLFTIGDITNNGPGSAYVVLEFDAVVTNTAINQDSRAPFENDYTINYNGTENDTSDPVEMTIVEPTLVTSKTSLATSDFTNGGTVTYELTVAHATGSPVAAHDVVITDTLPVGLTYAGNLVVELDGTPLSLGSGYTVTTPAPADPQVITIAIVDSLATTGVITAQFDATITTPMSVGSTVTNTVEATWTSDPDDDNDDRRDGSDPSDVDDYHDENTTDDTIEEDIEFEKRIAGHGATATNVPVTIGDIVTYELAFVADKGTTASIEITDVFEDGVEIVLDGLGDPILDIQSPSGLLTYTDASSYNPATRTLTVNFTNMVNAATDVTTSEWVVISFEVVVANNNVNNVGDIWNNTFDIETSNGTDETSNNVSILVHEPELEIEKTVVTTSAIFNGSTVTYGIRVENIGNAIAHDVVITDALDSAFTYVGNITGDQPDNVDVTGQDLTFEFTQIAVGGVVEFTFDAQITTAVQPGSTVDNTAITTWTTQPGDDPNERTGEGDPSDPSDPDTYIDESTVPITVRELSDIEKRIAQQTEASFLAGETYPVAIGDVITYQLVFLVDKNNTASIVVEDQLVDGIQYVAGSLNVNMPTGVTAVSQVDDVPDPATNGNKLTVTFTDVNNSNTDATVSQHIVITFDVLVLNETINNTGRIWENTFDVTTPSNPDPVTSNPVRAEVVEPQLNITKTAGNITGSVLTYTIRIEHTADSAATAYDLVITDVLPAEVTYVPNSVTAVTGIAPTVDDSGLPTLSFTIAELAEGDVIEFTFDVTLTAVLLTGDTFDNTADVTWTTQPGDDPNERDGSGDPSDPDDPNDHKDEDTTTTVVGQPSIEKRIAGHTQEEAESANGVPVMLGETVTYELAVRLNKDTVAELELVDIFALGIEYDPASIVIETVGAATINIGNEDINYDPATRTLTVTLTNVENTSTDLTAEEYIVVRFDVVVVDDEDLNSIGQIWANTFDLSVEGNPPTTSPPVNVNVVPFLADLEIIKSHSEDRFIVGNPEPYIYTIVVSNNGGREVEDAPVIVTDDIPAPYLQAVSAEGTNWACDVTGNAVECEYTGSYPIAVGAELDPIEVSVLAVEEGIFNNVAVVTAPNTPEITTDNNEYPDETIVRRPGIFDPPFGVKTVDGSGLPILQWGMVWINPEELIDGVAYRARVVDPIPAGTTYVNGSLSCYFADLSTSNFSTTDLCEFDAASNAVVWEGSLGASGGDMNIDTAPNRLYIVFETTLQEGVSHAHNVATANYDEDGDGDLDEGEGVIVVTAEYGDRPAPVVQDPAIVKLVNPIFAQRGETVTWTITVHNPHGVALDNVSFTDNMPSQFVITSTNASDGTVTVNGQVIHFTIGQLAPNQTATVHVVTRLADNAELPFVVDNTAVLDGPYRGQSTATVTGVAELPATGETPQILNNAIFRFIRDWHNFLNTANIGKD